MNLDTLRLQRLQNLGPFESLGAIAHELGVELILFGGTACRTAMHLYYQPDCELDIFDLAPFSSDIDLEHTGEIECTRKLLEAIQQRVPFASWFRWSINDRETAEKAKINRAVSTLVPLRQIRFSTHAQADIPDAAGRDLAQRKVSFSRNSAFAQSKIAIERLDLELHGLMLALNVEAEMIDIAGGVNSRIEREAAEWLNADVGELASARQNPRLSARFWNLVIVQLARFGRGSDLTEMLLKLADGHGVMDSFGVNLRDIEIPGRAVSVSKITREGAFRIPELAPEIYTGREALKQFGSLIGSLRKTANLPALKRNAAALIDPALELVAMIPRLTVKPYHSDSEPDEDEHDVFGSGNEQEFVQIAWQHRGPLALNSKGLTAQLVPWHVASLVNTSSLPAVGGVFGRDRAWVRARLDDIVDRNAGGQDRTASLLILQVRRG